MQMNHNGKLIFLDVEIVYDVLFASETDLVDNIVTFIQSRREFCNFFRDIGQFLGFSLKRDEYENFDIILNTDKNSMSSKHFRLAVFDA